MSDGRASNATAQRLAMSRARSRAAIAALDAAAADLGEDQYDALPAVMMLAFLLATRVDEWAVFGDEPSPFRKDPPEGWRVRRR